MKLLLLTQYYPPEGGSCSVHMGEMAHDLIQKGHQVTVITGFPNYPDGKIYPGYKRKLIQREQDDKVDLIRTFLFITAKRLAFGPRILNYFSFMISAFFGGLLAGKHDLIYFYSPPLFLGVTAGLLGKIWGAPVVMELNDLWPRAPISLGVIKNKWAVKIAETLESFVYGNTTKVFTYSRRMRQEVIKAGVPEDKVEIHNLWIDSETFKPAPAETAQQIKDEYDLNGKFVVMYTGLVGLAQGLEALVGAGEVLKQKGIDDIAIVIVGGGPERDGLVQMAREKELDNVLLIGQQPREAMAAFLSASDVLVSHLRAAPHRVGTIPAKILSYMAAQKPVLVGAEGEAADLVQRLDCGVAVPPDNPEEMVRGILELKAIDDKKRSQMALTGSQTVEQEYERQKVITKLEARLLRLAGEKP